MKKSNNKITGNLILGQNIRAIRISRKLTQEQFAEELEITPQFVPQIENGKVGISINKVIKICNLYNLMTNIPFRGNFAVICRYRKVGNWQAGLYTGIDLYGQGLKLEGFSLKFES